MGMICYLNQDFIPLHDCRIPISDLGLQRGYGIFDFFLAFDGQIRWKEDYFDRLFQSIHLSNIEISLSRSELDGICQELQGRNQLAQSCFKVIVTGGPSSDMGSYEDQPTLCVIQKPFIPLPNELYQTGANLISYEYARPDPEIKTLNYFASLRLHQKIKEYGATDVLFYSDLISEASRSNFFGIKNGLIHTPDSGILQGITRKNLLLLHDQGFHFEQGPIPGEELYSFDEVFLSGTSKGLLPIVQIDGKKIGNGRPGPVTCALRSKFSSLHPG